MPANDFDCEVSIKSLEVLMNLRAPIMLYFTLPLASAGWKFSHAFNVCFANKNAKGKKWNTKIV